MLNPVGRLQDIDAHSCECITVLAKRARHTPSLEGAPVFATHKIKGIADAGSEGQTIVHGQGNIGMDITNPCDQSLKSFHTKVDTSSLFRAPSQRIPNPQKQEQTLAARPPRS
eukprot:1156878-Pelagomonas_calceolata.AAC.4